MSHHTPIVLFTGIQRLARQIATMGFASACLVEPGERVSDPGDVTHWIHYDPSDLESLDRWARTWTQRARVLAVMNRRERRVMEHAVLNQALDRPGIDKEQARIMRDKLMLRRHLAERAPHLNPGFQEVGLDECVPPSLPLPFLLKPRNLFKSQLIVSCENSTHWERSLQEVKRGWEAAQRRHGVKLEPTLLAEEELGGRHFSVDALVTARGQAILSPPVALTTAREWGLEDFHVAVRFLPARLDPMTLEKLDRAVLDLIQALELRASPLHVDLVVEEQRVLVLDAAPRVGGYRSEMMELAWGCSLDMMSLKVAMGEEVEWEPRWERSVAVVEIFPKAPGILRSIDGLEQVRALDSFHRIKQRLAPGAEVGLARHGFRCPLFVVLCHFDPNVVAKDVSLLRELLCMEVVMP